MSKTLHLLPSLGPGINALPYISTMRLAFARENGRVPLWGDTGCTSLLCGEAFEELLAEGKMPFGSALQ
jgi:hypothetical protein